MDAGSTQRIQQAQPDAILEPDSPLFETLILHLMSPSNQQRSRAELLFNTCEQNNPDSLSVRLAQFLQFSPYVEGRPMVAFRLRLLLTRDDCYLWRRLLSSTQSSLKSLLLSSLQPEGTPLVTKTVCDTICKLASVIVPENGWPELLPLMFQCVQSDSRILQKSAFLILSELWQCMRSALIPRVVELHDVFSNILGSSPHPDPDVKIAAVISFIKCLSSPGDWNVFHDLLPAMIRALTEALNNDNEARAQEALKLLIELARSKPRFLRRLPEDVVGSMLQVAELGNLEEEKHLAVEFLITLAEALDGAPGMTQFITRLFAILMRMLLDIKDNAETEDEDDGEISNYCVGQEWLYRLAIAMRGNTIFPVASEQFKSYLAAPEWQMRHAALIALAKIAEGCSKVMITNRWEVVLMVLKSFDDPHPHVRWAAINAIVQLSTYLYPDFSLEYHELVLPKLASAMDDFQNPRVQAHAASAVLNFGVNRIREIWTPDAVRIVSKLPVLLQNGNPMVQVEALTAFLLEACEETNPDVRRAAVHGLGVCAEFGGSVFKPVARDACSKLIAVTRRRDARENVMAYNNAVSALGKICWFHRDSVDSAQVVPKWLDCLPIEGDLTEAKVVHEQLCLMMERSDQELLSPSNGHHPKIFAVFAEVLYHNDLATEETSRRMSNLLRQFRQTLPPDAWDSAVSSMDDWPRHQFDYILRRLGEPSR